jgi:hypothetical protein
VSSKSHQTASILGRFKHKVTFVSIVHIKEISLLEPFIALLGQSPIYVFGSNVIRVSSVSESITILKKLFLNSHFSHSTIE